MFEVIFTTNSDNKTEKQSKCDGVLLIDNTYYYFVFGFSNFHPLDFSQQILKNDIGRPKGRRKLAG